MKKEPYILVFGESMIDIIGIPYTTYKSHDSNPGKVKLSYGGVCRNIADNLARIDVNTKLITFLGNDINGQSLMNYHKTINLDMINSFVFNDANTSTYMAILDEKGEMVSAISDMSITKLITKDLVDSREELFVNAEYTIVGPNNPQILKYILEKYYKHTKFILDPISTKKAENIKHLLPYFHTIKPNLIEAEVLCGFSIQNNQDLKKAGQFFIDLGISNIFISLGSKGIYYKNIFDEGIIKTSNNNVINVTGAGDAFVSGISYGFLNNYSIQDVVRFGLTLSIITIESEETINPALTLSNAMNKLQELVFECVTI